MLLRALFIVFSLTALVGAAFWVDPGITAESSPTKLFANAAPVALLYLLTLGLTRRPIVAAITSAALLFLVFSAHFLKLEHLNQPLKFADAFLATQTITNWDLLSQYAPKSALFALAAAVVIAIMLARFERPQKLWVNAVFAVLGGAGLVTISQQLDATASLYGDRAHGANPWATEAIAPTQGLLASLVGGARSTQFSLPQADQPLIDQFASTQEMRTDSAPTTKPDIILWLGESFFDPGVISGVESCQQLPVLCTFVSDTTEHSVIDVPTFGGNTTRTEFEVLTAIPFHDLGTQDYPYISIVQQKHSSIAWSLANLGYRTTAIHPNNASMWQRNRALPLLGFETFISKRDFDKSRRDGIFISDDALAEKVENTLQQSDEPQFVLAISMEGHGPFKKRDVLEPQRRDAITAPAQLDEKAAVQWREYMYHAQNALLAMQRLQVFIEQRDRPTLLVFFGDHLPQLKDFFDQVTFKNGLAGWQQSTPTFAIANYPIDSRWQPSASHQLGVWTLDLAKLAEHTQYALLNEALIRVANDTPPPEGTVKALQIRQLYTQVENDRL